MTKQEVKNTIEELCRDIFRNADLVLEDSMTAQDVKGWDSLTNLQLMSEIEDEFDITFGLNEVNNFKNVGDLIESVFNHVNE